MQFDSQMLATSESPQDAIQHKQAGVTLIDHSAERGFTLIELSIVLVIIGLIVGGVLVGQDMIRAAEIRATVSQIEKLNTAVNTFRGKYGYLPGDMPTTVAITYGFWNMTAHINAVGFGDGNGMLEGCGAAATIGCGETLAFFRHLTDAALIDGNYGTATAGNALDPTDGNPATAIPAAQASTLFPPAKMGRGNYITVYSANGLNFYEITGMTAMSTGGTYTQAYAMTPLEAQNINQKTDDGLPLTGNVTAQATGGLGTLASTGAGAVCVVSSLYNVVSNSGGANLYGNDLSCALSLRFN